MIEIVEFEVSFNLQDDVLVADSTAREGIIKVIGKSEEYTLKKIERLLQGWSQTCESSTDKHLLGQCLEKVSQLDWWSQNRGYGASVNDRHVRVQKLTKPAYLAII